MMGQNCLANRFAYSGLTVGGGWGLGSGVAGGLGVGIGVADGQAQPATNNTNNINRPKLLFMLPYYTAFLPQYKGLTPALPSQLK